MIGLGTGVRVYLAAGVARLQEAIERRRCRSPLSCLQKPAESLAFPGEPVCSLVKYPSWLNAVEGFPARKGRKHPAVHDAEKYKWRHLVENYFQKLKEFKRIAMRSDKTDESFTAMIHIAAAIINAR